MKEEIDRLTILWKRNEDTKEVEIPERLLNPDQLKNLDRIERIQLIEIIKICRESRNLSEAGRILYNASRTLKSSTNDADRLKKFLARYNLSWDQIRNLENQI